MEKERVDVLLVRRGLASTREQARRLTMAGLVFSGTDMVDKPGAKLPLDVHLTVKGALHPYVSRGGLKLEKALQTFPVSLAGRTVIDVGASTGGFTDCALQHGARLVYSVDVGYGQLAWSLRQDERVRVMERVNFRHVEVEQFDPRPDAAVMDVSFISIEKLLPKLLEILLPDSPVLALVKPQFEAGPKLVGKGGIVRDPAVHLQVLRRLIDAADRLGFCACGLTFSPIRGGEGNIEYLLWLQANGGPELEKLADETVTRVVEAAQQLESHE